MYLLMTDNGRGGERFISTAETREEADAYVEKYTPYLNQPITAKEWEDLVPSDLTLEQKIIKTLDLSDLNYEYCTVKEGSAINLVKIAVQGDWKHTHKWLDRFMDSLFWAVVVTENIISEDDSDYYASEHVFSTPQFS